MKRSARWRTLAFILLAVILILNCFIFFTLPSTYHSDVFSVQDAPLPPQSYNSQGISHLRIPRKRLNKSNITSESVGADGTGVIGGGGGWEGNGDHPPPLLHSQPGRFDPPIQNSYKEQGQLLHLQNNSDDQPSTGRVYSAIRGNLTDPQVDAFMRTLKERRLLDLLPGLGLKEDYWMFLKRQRRHRNSGVQLPAYKNYKPTTNWERFHSEIHQHYLYNADSPVIDHLLNDLAEKPIIDVEQKEGGTQIKLIITFEDEGQALLKPMRFPREIGTLPDHFYFADYERHVAEVAAFHLDRVLGYNRVPPVAGRVVNMTRDLRSLADSKLARTFFISPAGNLCFHGYCSYYCDSGHPVCGHPDQLEVSLMAFLPPEKMAHRQTWRNPWKRSYSKHRKAYWEVYDDLCEKLQNRSPYNNTRRLLDIIDMSVMDFLMGNLDRHHYETFRSFGNDTFVIHLDHGRGFGRFHQDEMSCLAPLLQCCVIRLATLQRLVRLYRGPLSLSTVMRAVLSKDRIAPVLLEPHLQALDRRLLKILKALVQCTQDEGRTLHNVIVDDGIF